MEGRQRDEFIAQVLSTIEESEVLTIFFPNLGKSLIIDVRRNQVDGPLIRVVNQVNSMEERMSNIEKMRPGLGRVRSIAGIPWIKSIRTLKENEVLERVQNRLEAGGMDSQEAARVCSDAYQSLKDLEYNQWVELIKGKNPFYKTIWDQTGK